MRSTTVHLQQSQPSDLHPASEIPVSLATEAPVSFVTDTLHSSVPESVMHPEASSARLTVGADLCTCDRDICQVCFAGSASTPFPGAETVLDPPSMLVSEYKYASTAARPEPDEACAPFTPPSDCNPTACEPQIDTAEIGIAPESEYDSESDMVALEPCGLNLGSDAESISVATRPGLDPKKGGCSRLCSRLQPMCQQFRRSLHSKRAVGWDHAASWLLHFLCGKNPNLLFDESAYPSFQRCGGHGPRTRGRWRGASFGSFRFH